MLARLDSLRTLSLALLALGLLAPRTGAAQLVVTSSNSPYVISATTSQTSVTVDSGGTLVVDAPLTVSGNLTVLSGGTVTHNQGVVSAALDVMGTLDVQVGGAINLTGKGLLGGNLTGNSFGIDGQTYAAGNVLTAGATAHNGGSHGGIGGSGPTIYDNQDTPTLPGGGGGGGACNDPGGDGGGFISIIAGTLQVDGALSADGTVATAGGCGTDGGGGAGGGIRATVGALTGAGSITARGAGGNGEGGGGGGRIQLSYMSSTFTGSITAVAGPNPTNFEPNANGTVEVVDTATNALTVLNGYYTLEPTTTWSSVTLGTAGYFIVAGAGTVTQPITVLAGTTVALELAAALTNVDVVPTIAGTLVVGVPITFPASTNLEVQSGGELDVDALLTVQGNLTVDTGGLVTEDQGFLTSALNVSGTISIATGGAIDVSGEGLIGGNLVGNSFGIDGQTWSGTTLASGAVAHAGGSHGGLGAGGPAIFDSQDDPTLSGGGGGGGACNDPGGNGGGYLAITAASLQVAGALRADGAPAVSGGCGDDGGGGAGGGLLVKVASLGGTGAITAFGGGNTPTGSGAGGGGGRIQITYSGTNTFTGQLSAIAGIVGDFGPVGGGTVELINSAANAISVTQGSYTLGSSASWTSVTLGAGGELIVAGSGTITQPVSVLAGTTVALTSAAALTKVTVIPQIAGTLIIQAPITFPAATNVEVQSGGEIDLDNALTVQGNLTVDMNGLITQDQAVTASALKVSGTLDVAPGGAINMAGTGLPGSLTLLNTFANDVGETYSSNTVVAGNGQHTGGSHGGIGGGGPAAYDNQDSPALPGGSGGSGGCNDPGGNGGGYLAITAGTLQVDGALRVDGTVPASGGCGADGGGGAGGGLYAKVGTFAGVGTISATGGAATAGGGGGGGRVQITYGGTSTYSGIVTAVGGTSVNYPPGGEGSVEIVGTAGNNISVIGGTYTLGASNSWSSVTLGSLGELIIAGAGTVTQPITIAPGSSLAIETSTALANLSVVPTFGGTLIVGAPITFPASTSLTINSGGAIIADQLLTVQGNLVVQSGANITHDQGVWTAALNVSGTLDVQTGGSINVSSAGLLGAYQLGNPYSGAGEAVSGVSMGMASGAVSSEGGSHGGVGAQGLPAYDNQDDPQQLGSGGGGGGCNDPGGNGGGFLSIIAGTLDVDGVLRADGEVTPSGGCGATGGAGAGGAINATVASLIGAGTISANGGSSPGGGGGGGGRIWIGYSGTDSFTGAVSATAGTSSGFLPATAGTVKVVNTGAGTLGVTGGVYNLGGSTSLSTVTLGPGGNLVITGAPTVSQPISIPAGATITLASSTALSNISINPNIAGSLVVTAPVSWPAGQDITLSSGASMVIDQPFTTPGNLNVDTGAVITHDQGATTSALSVGGTILVQSGAAIDVSGKGLLGGYVLGNSFGGNGQTLSGTTTVVAGAGNEVGASHGGIGANGGLPIYDDEDAPAQLGSGGGGGPCNSPGGTGGGAMAINAGTLVLTGNMRADGEPPPSGGCGLGGGGAGGALDATLGSFSGNGLVSAVGAAAQYGGGGGRIRITASTNLFAGSVTVAGGAGSANVTVPSGGIGTIELVNTATNALTFPVASTLVLTSASNWSSVTVATGATIDITGAATVTQSLAIGQGVTAVLSSSDALANLSLVSPLVGTLVVDGPISLATAFTVAGTLQVNAPLSGTNLTIAGTMIVDAPVSLSETLLVPAGGLVTHDPGDTGFQLSVAGAVDVQSGAGIDVSGKGLPGGGVSPYGDSGAAIDPLALTELSGSGSFSGGSYGGLGGASGGNTVNALYGNATDPLYLGAGGGEGSCSQKGGAGGGLIVLQAGSLDVAGYLRANGASPATGTCQEGGGGAGGGINVQVETTFAGNGSVIASGGISTSGGGGGGRILITAETNSFTGTIVAAGGAGAPAGSNGTVSVDATGSNTLLIEGGESTIGTGDMYSSVTLESGGVLDITGAASVAQPIVVPAGAQLIVDSPDALSNLTISPDIAGTVTVNFASKQLSNFVLSGTLIVNDRFEVENLTTVGGALVTHSPGMNGMNLIVDATFTLVVGSSVDASGKGYAPGALAGYGEQGATLDPNSHDLEAGSGQDNGGSHAGLGGKANTSQPVAAIYDYPTAPLYGGGGGGEGSDSTNGGAGGGVVRVSAAAFHVNGFVGSNGVAALGAGGGGAGGSVIITAGDLDGTTGSITANGGSSISGGGGGAGIVVITYGATTFTGTVSATGGAGKVAGANGTMNQSSASIPPAVTSIAPLNASVGVQYTYDPTASGASPFAWSLVAGPTGATVNPSTGAFTWTPSVDGTVSATIQVSNSAGSSQQTFTINAYTKPAITSTPGTAAQVGLPYQYDASNQATATGTGPFTWSVPSSPGGFVIGSTTGVIGWTPQTMGVDQICIAVANFAGSAQQCFSVTVAPPTGTAPQITSMGSTTGLVGQPYNYDTNDIATATGTSPITWSASPAPSGFQINSTTGAVSWTPNIAGQYQACIQATNPIGSALQCINIQVTAGATAVAPTITSTATTTATVGVPYSYDAQGAPTATGTQPIAWSAALAPSGFQIDPVTGAITWTPQTAGMTGVCIDAVNTGGQAQQCFEVQVAPGANTGAPVITSTASLTATVGALYQYDAGNAATATPAQGVTWSTLVAPPSFSINPTSGAIVWTPGTAGPQGICIQATNTFGETQQCFEVQVATATGTPPVITSVANLRGAAGMAYSYDATGAATATGTAPITWSTLIAPAGFAIDPNAGTVSWTPVAPGQYGVCLVATNPAGTTQQCFEVTITGASSGSAPLITSTPSPAGQVGVAYAYDSNDTVTASGAAPMAWSVLLGPPGFAIDPAQGTVSWMPDAAGPQGVCLQASNSFGQTSQCYTVTVAPGAIAPQFTSTGATVATVGTAYAYDTAGALTASGTAPMTFGVMAGPAGLTVDPNAGTVTWTPTTAGNVMVAFTATNSAGTAVQQLGISVLPAGGSTSAAPVIVHNANGTAAAGVAYLYDASGIATAGGTAPITWTLTSGPPGFQIDGATGTVSWLPVEPGTASVTLQATNSFGQDQYTFQVAVDSSGAAAPVASLSVAPSVGDAPLAVTADGSRSYPAPGTTLSSYRWDFGDGTPYAFGETATHTYALPGGAVVRLRVFDDLGDWAEASAQEAVTSGGHQPPTALIQASQTSGQDSLSVVFTCDCQAGFTPITAYHWDFGDGTTSGDQTVTHTFPAGGYQVRLLVVDQDGLSASDHVFISVSAGGQAPVTVTARASPVAGVAPLAVSYSAAFVNFIGAVAVSWQFPDGTTATGADVTHSYATPGIQTATVTVTGSGLTSTSSVDVIVTNAAGQVPPHITSVASTTAEVGVPYVYDSQGQAAAQGDAPITWSLGSMVGGTLVGAPTGMSIDPTTGQITWTPAEAQAGSVPVTIVATNAAGNDTQDFTVIVTGLPDAGTVDAGMEDAGPIDAGPVDAGPIDAGPVDAGPIDAGVTTDAGMTPVTPAKGCGCGGGAADLGWLLVGAAALARRRRACR